MDTVIDTSVWIDYFGKGTPAAVKRLADQLLNDAGVHICELVRFELLRAVSGERRSFLESYLATFPQLANPRTLWERATALGQRCAGHGFVPRPLDLLIAQTCLHHRVSITTFDEHFERIGGLCDLRVLFHDRAAVSSGGR